MMHAAEMPPVLQEYLDAFTARDLSRCLDLFDADASLEFGPATYKGQEALKKWHNARFDANLQLVQIDDVRVDGETVTVDGVITSKRLKAWRIKNLGGRVTFKLHDGKIAQARFGLRSHNPLEAYRS